ncbi:MAG: ribosome-associated translation inhibitor RaiA [Armatimonadetes bacterium]|nr:ribosome-associated translation inhibitor RaiA [Armatimonadota bacterium]
MQITVKGKNVEVTEALRSHAEKRISKIERYFDRIINTDVTLSTERNWHIVEVTVHANGHVLRGEERTNDMYSSIDKVIDKLEKQVKREKGKVTRKGRGSHLGEELVAAAEAEVPGAAAPVDGDVHKLEPHVEHLKRFNSPPLSVEQAVKEIEASGLEFYVFNNQRNGRINVLYKRAKGYGLIDPIPV